MNDPISAISAPRGTPAGMKRASLTPDSVNPPKPPDRVREIAPTPPPVVPPQSKADIVLALLERAQQNALPYFQGRIERLPDRLRSKISPALTKRLADYRKAWMAYTAELDAHDSSRAHPIREAQHAAAIADPLGAPTPATLDGIKRTLRLKREAIDGAFRKTAVPAGLAITRDFVGEVRPHLTTELDELVREAREWNLDWRLDTESWDSRHLALARTLVSLGDQLAQSEQSAASGNFCLAECCKLLD